MSLSDQQFKFAKDVILLLNFALSRGWKFTFGEVQRTDYQQAKYLEEGKTTVSRSLHQDKLAIDINFFKPSNKDMIGGFLPKVGIGIMEYRYTTQKEDLQELGDFWESLDPKNEWGGNWNDFLDTPHFQRNKN